MLQSAGGGGGVYYHIVMTAEMSNTEVPTAKKKHKTFQCNQPQQYDKSKFTLLLS